MNELWQWYQTNLWDQDWFRIGQYVIWLIGGIAVVIGTFAAFDDEPMIFAYAVSAASVLFVLSFVWPLLFVPLAIGGLGTAWVVTYKDIKKEVQQSRERKHAERESRDELRPS